MPNVRFHGAARAAVKERRLTAAVPERPMDEQEEQKLRDDVRCEAAVQTLKDVLCAPTR